MIRFEWDDATQTADVVMGPAGIKTTEHLAPASLISLLSDAEPQEGDQVPDENGYRRGWWADPSFGSLLWLTESGKETEWTAARIAEACEDAHRWMIDLGIASRVSASAEWIPERPGSIRLTLEIYRPGTIAPAWRDTWEVTLNGF